MSDVLDTDFVESFLDGWLNAWREMDSEALAAKCAPDVVLDDTGANRALVGREDVAEYLGGLLLAAAIESIENRGMYLSQDRQRLLAHHVTVVRPPGSTEVVAVEGVAVFEFVDGLIARWTALVRDPDWMGR